MNENKTSPSISAPEDEWLTQAECRKQVILHTSLLLARPVGAAIVSPFLPAEMRLFPWFVFGFSMCFSDELYKLCRALRNYRTVKRTRKPILLTPIRKAHAAEGEALYAAILSSVVVLLMLVAFGFMWHENPPIKSAQGHIAAFVALATSGFLTWKWGKWARLRRERLALQVEAARTIPAVSEPATMPKHWWTSNDTRDVTQNAGRK